MRESLDREDRQGETEAEFTINLDLDRVDALAGELDSSKDMDIRRVGVEGRELEFHFTSGDRFLVLRIQDRRLLRELPDSAAPAGPEAEFEKAERNRRSGNHADDADQRLLAASLLAHILAEDAGLEIGQDGFVHDGVGDF